MLRAAAAALAALVGLVVADRFGGLDNRAGLRTHTAVLTVVGAGMVLIGGLACVRWSARATRLAMPAHAGEGRAAATSVVTSIAGYILVAVATLSALKVNVANLLLGGALTGLVLGIAAQQVLANFFAGIVLLIVRPFEVGHTIALRAGSIGAEYEGKVTDMSAFYVRIETDNGWVDLPNASVLAAAVGPGARTTPRPDPEPEVGTEPDSVLPDPTDPNR